jgi:hypothetical protein
VNLPSGYHSYLDPEMLVLRREDGSTVAPFSSRGFVAQAVEQVAWEDHSESEGRPALVPLATVLLAP